MTNKIILYKRYKTVYYIYTIIVASYFGSRLARPGSLFIALHPIRYAILGELKNSDDSQFYKLDSYV